MAQIGPSPFVWLQFDEAGGLSERDAALAALDEALSGAGVEDLVVLSHGWKTDLEGARQLYSRLWDDVVAELGALGRDPSRVVVAGVLWPSKAYNADYDGGRALSASAGGGALAAGEPALADPDLPEPGFEQVLADIEGLLGAGKAAALVEAARQAAQPGSGAEAARALFLRAHEALGLDAAPDDPELAQDAALPAGAKDDSLRADDLLQAFSHAVQAPAPAGAGAASGLGDTIRGIYEGARHGVGQALNQLSYYTMKARAGVVGQALGRNVLPALQPPAACRLHLVGHSFGARLVTAAADAFQDTERLKLRSLTLLQGAFSHNGMTEGKGPFSAVPGKVPGPIAITHTFNDWACSVAYPLASFLAQDSTKRIGDANDPFGAMGANGALLPKARLAPDEPGRDFKPVAGRVNRFLADAYVVKTTESDAHNNVTNADCGRLVARVMSA